MRELQGHSEPHVFYFKRNEDNDVTLESQSYHARPATKSTHPIVLVPKFPPGFPKIMQPTDIKPKVRKDTLEACNIFPDIDDLQQYYTNLMDIPFPRMNDAHKDMKTWILSIMPTSSDEDESDEENDEESDGEEAPSILTISGRCHNVEETYHPNQLVTVRYGKTYWVGEVILVQRAHLIIKKYQKVKGGGWRGLNTQSTQSINYENIICSVKLTEKGKIRREYYKKLKNFISPFNN